MCVYACTKRSCRHVKDPTVRVIVWWIMEMHRYCMHIKSGVNILYFCIKKRVAWRVRLDNAWLTLKLELFQTGGTNSEVPNESPSASRPLASTDTTCLILFCFFQAKSASYCLPFAHSSHMKDCGFSYDNCNGWWSWPIIKSHTDNAWLKCWQTTTTKKQKEKKKGCTGC